MNNLEIIVTYIRYRNSTRARINKSMMRYHHNWSYRSLRPILSIFYCVFHFLFYSSYVQLLHPSSSFNLNSRHRRGILPHMAVKSSLASLTHLSTNCVWQEKRRKKTLGEIWTWDFVKAKVWQSTMSWWYSVASSDGTWNLLTVVNHRKWFNGPSFGNARSHQKESVLHLQLNASAAGTARRCSGS